MSQFVESLKRLYVNHKIYRSRIVKLFEENKITEEEMNYILSR